MLFTTISASLALLTLGGVMAAPAPGNNWGHSSQSGNNNWYHDSGDYNDEGFGFVRVQKLCPGLNTENNGCIRYTRGFDVTGVVTEVDLTFPQIQSACDCIQQCLDRPNTCAAWVYKFTTPASVQSGHRTCTLYSQFNLPNDVTIEVDTTKSVNFNLLQPGNNPQAGAPVPQAFKDINLNTTADDDAFSGVVWQLQSGVAQC